jgi:hypothetical protein
MKAPPPPVYVRVKRDADREPMGSVRKSDFGRHGPMVARANPPTMSRKLSAEVGRRFAADFGISEGCRQIPAAKNFPQSDSG